MKRQRAARQYASMFDGSNSSPELEVAQEAKWEAMAHRFPDSSRPLRRVCCQLNRILALVGESLFLHGMQEVWGSNPHSSTPGQKHNSKSRAHGSRGSYSSKVQQQPQRKPSHASSDLTSVRMQGGAWPVAARARDNRRVRLTSQNGALFRGCRARRRRGGPFGTAMPDLFAHASCGRATGQASRARRRWADADLPRG
jgi:hypothetical protein